MNDAQFMLKKNPQKGNLMTPIHFLTSSPPSLPPLTRIPSRVLEDQELCLLTGLDSPEEPVWPSSIELADGGVVGQQQQGLSGPACHSTAF